jgi:hypothetical protein
MDIIQSIQTISTVQYPRGKGVSRMENSRKKSCVQCRAAKARCSLAMPHCLRCVKKNLACKYEHQIRNETCQQVTPYHTWLIRTSSSELPPWIPVINPTTSSTNDNERISEILDFDIFSGMAVDTIFPEGLDWNIDMRTSNESIQPGTFSAIAGLEGDDLSWAQPLPRDPKVDENTATHPVSPLILLPAGDNFDRISQQACRVMKDPSFNAAAWYALNEELKISRTFMGKRPQRTMPGVFTSSLSWATIRDYAVEFSQGTFPPFIHRSHLENLPTTLEVDEVIFPETLENCRNIISMYLKMKKNGYSFINKAIILEVHRLYSEVGNGSSVKRQWTDMKLVDCSSAAVVSANDCTPFKL